MFLTQNTVLILFCTLQVANIICYMLRKLSHQDQAAVQHHHHLKQQQLQQQHYPLVLKHLLGQGDYKDLLLLRRNSSEICVDWTDLIEVDVEFFEHIESLMISGI